MIDKYLDHNRKLKMIWNMKVTVKFLSEKKSRLSRPQHLKLAGIQSRTSIDKIRENGFELTKKRSRRYSAKTITDADYADDIALLANTHNQAETLLHSLERAAAGIDLHVNAHKTEYMCYNQTGDISIQDRTSLKLVDKFTYLGTRYIYKALISYINRWLLKIVSDWIVKFPWVLLVFKQSWKECKSPRNSE